MHMIIADLRHFTFLKACCIRSLKHNKTILELTIFDISALRVTPSTENSFNIDYDSFFVSRLTLVK